MKFPSWLLVLSHGFESKKVSIGNEKLTSKLGQKRSVWPSVSNQCKQGSQDQFLWQPLHWEQERETRQEGGHQELDVHHPKHEGI